MPLFSSCCEILYLAEQSYIHANHQLHNTGGNWCCCVTFPSAIVVHTNHWYYLYCHCCSLIFPQVTIHAWLSFFMFITIAARYPFTIQHAKEAAPMVGHMRERSGYKWVNVMLHNLTAR